ncbi:pre-mRNA-splicing factor CWC25 homolog isoform X1 [Oscarella lobularis]|uniref:pre-mRNA-splicing factor CWC25 homolog isoform X1 n=1 Tax=Oscarella lobularis TaxID=121494 RepID=UPI00331420A7
MNQGTKQQGVDKVDWMYRQAGVNKEEYLLGRTIDRHANPLFDPSKEAGASGGPGALFAESQLNVSVDMANKMREDPLFAIKKTEHEHRKALINNPIRMKQLQEMLSSGGSKKKEKKEKKHKHHHKHHEERHRKDDDKHGRDRDRRKRSRSRSRSPHRRKGTSPDRRDDARRMYPSYRHKPRRPERRRLGSEEMERRRKEMMQDAKASAAAISARLPPKIDGQLDVSMYDLFMHRARDEEREARVRKYRDDFAREQSELQDEKDVKFIHSLKVASYSSATSSVEDRIKRNINSVQRTGASLAKNFVKKHI